MVRREKSVIVKAPLGKIWEMLVFDRMPEWMDGWEKAEYTSEVHTPQDKYRVGASCRMNTNEGVVDIEITESLENEKIAYRVQGMKGVRNVNGAFTLKPTEAGTKITATSNYEMSNIAMKILDKLVSRAIEKEFEKSLEKLKSILER